MVINDELRKKIAILGAFTKEEIAQIEKYLTRVEYKEGEKVFLQNSSPENIYIVERGEVEFKVKGERRDCLLKIYEEGDCFGQIALLGIVSNLGDCTALNDVSLLQLSKFSFHKLSKENNGLFTKLLLNITREICRYNHYLLNKIIEKVDSDDV